MAAIPILMVAITAAILASQYDALPEKLVAHWGTHGPDRWVAKSWRSVYGVLIIGAAALCVLAFARSKLRHAVILTEWHGRLRSLHERILVAIAFCCAVLFCNIALAPIGNPATTPVHLGLTLLPTLVVVVWGVWRQLQLQSEPGAPSESKLNMPDNWQVVVAGLGLTVLIWFVAP